MTRTKVYLIIQAALCVLLVAMLSVSAVSIYREGAARKAEHPLEPIYTREIAAERFAPIAPVCFIAIGLMVAGLVLGAKDDRVLGAEASEEIFRLLPERSDSGLYLYEPGFGHAAFDTAPDYKERLPVIYSYLLAVSRDSLALPFTPGTKKLGGGNGLSDLSGGVEMPFPMRGTVLIAKQMTRYLETIAQKHGLKEAELRILYCMEKMKEPCDAESLCLLTGLEKRVVNAALNRLSTENYVRDELFADVGERFSFQAPELLEDFQHLDRDMDAVCFDGFSEEEIGQYCQLQERINANILRRLQGETAKL
jgi:hypothetical protein